MSSGSVRPIIKITSCLFAASVSIVSVVGATLAEPSIDRNPHEKLLDPSLRRNKNLTRKECSVSWKGSELTYDMYTDSKASSKKYLIVYIAPPSFVASRTSFLDAAERVNSNFVITEVPGYGKNAKRGIEKDLLEPSHLIEGVGKIMDDINKHSMPGTIVYVVASGHASPYVTELKRVKPEIVSKLVLLNPTIRGPLASAQMEMEKKNKQIIANIIAVMRSISWLLYQIPYFGSGMHYLLNTPSNIEHQLRTHVFYQDSMINENSILLNHTFSRTGTSLPKCAFLVGRLDTSIEQFANSLSKISPSVSVIVGTDSPPNTQYAMSAINRSGVKVYKTPGMLRSFEEYPTETSRMLRLALNLD